MTVGIGAAGILGLAVEQLSPPVQATVTTSTSGGTLPTASTYKYYVTALNANGETTVSNEQSVTTGAGSTNKNTVSWAAITGATSYKIYRTAADGATDSELFLATVTAPTVTYEDTGSETPAGAFPTTNTAVTPGTYVAPTKYMPFNSETLVVQNETVFRRPIRQSADIIGAVAGNYHPEGEVQMEALEDCILYFLWASRTSIVKSGTTNYTYVITPTSAAIPNKTLSLTIVRNGIVFGYTGIVASSFAFGIQDGLLTFTVNVKGRDEAVQSSPTPTWPTTVPFGAGSYTIEVPTGTTVTDTDTFEWTVEDNAEVNFRLKDTGRGAQFINYGERNSTMNLERDFEARTDYDAFKAVTSQSVTLTASKGANNKIILLAPVAIKDTYEVGLSGQGDLVRATITYQNVIDGTGKSWEITIKTQESIIP